MKLIAKLGIFYQIIQLVIIAGIAIWYFVPKQSLLLIAVCSVILLTNLTSLWMIISGLEDKKYAI